VDESSTKPKGAKVQTQSVAHDRKQRLRLLLASGLIMSVAILLVVALTPVLGRFLSPQWSAYTDTVMQPFCGSWNTTVGPRLLTGDVTAVDASAPDDVWAVGSKYIPFSNAQSKALIMHFSGAKWTEVDDFQPGNPNTSSNVSLTGVSVVSPNEVWLVGEASNSSMSAGQGLILHWNGNNWNSVALPQLDASSGRLQAVAALSTNDVWAVGSYTPDLGASGPNAWQPLVLHWNGREIERVDIQAMLGLQSADLNGISVLSADDIWAVGTRSAGVAGNNNSQTLTLHWDGRTWAIVPSPNLGPHSNVLEDVVPINSSDVWAVGTATKPLAQWESTLSEPIIMHWDGKEWTLHTSSGIAAGTAAFTDYSLHAVSAVSPFDIWAVGSQVSHGEAQQLILHSDGMNWHIVDGPTRRGNQSFRDVKTFRDGTLWAVGDLHKEDEPALGLAAFFQPKPCPSQVTPTTYSSQ
jgi:hypothetical protein